MKNLLLLLSFLFYQAIQCANKKKETDSEQKINKWFEKYSCNELQINELKIIAVELEKIIKEFDGNLNHLETLLAEYCHEVAEKHVHTECFLAVVKACEETILRKYNKTSSFQKVLFQYSKKINDAVNQRTVKNYKIS